MIGPRIPSASSSSSARVATSPLPLPVLPPEVCLACAFPFRLCLLFFDLFLLPFPEPFDEDEDEEEDEDEDEEEVDDKEENINDEVRNWLEDSLDEYSEEDREEIAEVFEAYGWTVIDDFVRATREDQKQALREVKKAVKAHCTEEEIYADLKVALKELLEGAA